MSVYPFSWDEAQRLADRCGTAVLDAAPVPFGKGPAWRLQFPDEPGVYVLSEGTAAIYVGETGNLRARLGDLSRTVNHTARRTIGSHLCGNWPDFVPASGRKKFPESIESHLDDWMIRHLTVRCLGITFGRAEVEQHLIARLKPTFNKKVTTRVKK